MTHIHRIKLIIVAYSSIVTPRAVMAMDAVDMQDVDFSAYCIGISTDCFIHSNLFPSIFCPSDLPLAIHTEGKIQMGISALQPQNHIQLAISCGGGN